MSNTGIRLEVIQKIKQLAEQHGLVLEFDERMLDRTWLFGRCDRFSKADFKDSV